MDAKELRIGNLIHKGTFEAWKTTVSDIYNIQLNHKLGRYQPITLTEEWLLKFGFNLNAIFKTYSKYCYCSKSRIEIVFHDDEFTLAFNNVKIKYVHQLQNLYFALTGEELTVK